MILADTNRVDALLADLLVDIPETEEDIDEQAVMREIEKAFEGQKPLSETIIQERHQEFFP